MSIVHHLRLRYSNAYLVVGNRPILVDTGSRGDAARIEAGSILHTPGHTAGSIALLLDSGDAIIGDTIMGGYMGGAVLGSRPNYHSFADDVSLAMASLDRVLSASSQRLFVGHGGYLRHEDVARWQTATAPRM